MELRILPHAEPAAARTHAKTGQRIALLAPAANGDRFTSVDKAEKWFRRNCNDVVGRTCTAREKGDVLAYLTLVKPQERAMNPESRQWACPMAAWAIGLICALVPVANAAADQLKTLRGTNTAWSGECGGCHLPYPPQLLPAGSWRALMQGFDKHFGTDASVDPKTAATIGAFLEANAGRERSGKPEAAVLRITETRWFGHEHSGKAAATWKAGRIKSPADCAACHRQAADGDFGERTLRLPQ